MTAWTRFSDRMPPDDETKIIVSLDSSYTMLHSVTGKYAREVEDQWKDVMPPVSTVEWTYYTPELWKQLNK